MATWPGRSGFCWSWRPVVNARTPPGSSPGWRTGSANFCHLLPGNSRDSSTNRTGWRRNRRQAIAEETGDMPETATAGVFEILNPGAFVTTSMASIYCQSHVFGADRIGRYPFTYLYKQPIYNEIEIIPSITTFDRAGRHKVLSIYLFRMKISIVSNIGPLQLFHLKKWLKGPYCEINSMDLDLKNI